MLLFFVFIIIQNFCSLSVNNYQDLNANQQWNYLSVWNYWFAGFVFLSSIDG